MAETHTGYAADREVFRNTFPRKGMETQISAASPRPTSRNFRNTFPRKGMETCRLEIPLQPLAVHRLP